jgi:hypothetical protein
MKKAPSTLPPAGEFPRKKVLRWVGWNEYDGMKESS